MPVGIGLDHGKRLALRGALLGEQVVVTKRGQIDRGNQRTHEVFPVQRRVGEILLLWTGPRRLAFG